MALTFSHRVTPETAHTHTRTEAQTILFLLNHIHARTHTHTWKVVPDRELLTACTWPDRPFTISHCVKANALKECVCVCEYE